jgi:hypothetical protein
MWHVSGCRRPLRGRWIASSCSRSFAQQSERLDKDAHTLARDEKQVYKRSLPAPRIDSPLGMLHQLRCLAASQACARARIWRTG